MGYTPGPWHVMVGTFGKHHDPKSATVYATNNDLVYVARCDGSQPMCHDNLDAIANAHLIAAAPELLSSCKALLEIAEESVEICDHDAGICFCGIKRDIDIAKDAIAKAEGR